MKFTLKPQHNQASAITDGFMLLKSPLLNKPARLDILTCRSLPDLKVATDPLILVRYPKICNDDLHKKTTTYHFSRQHLLRT